MKFYIYIMKAGDFVKIGVTNNPDNRKAHIQTGNPHEIELVAVLPFDQ